MKLISTQEIVNKFKLSYQTVNYYTNLGILPVRKRIGNKRLYDEKEIGSSIRKIDDLKTKGYPLRLIIAHFNGKGVI